jgi:hypothetical protein
MKQIRQSLKAIREALTKQRPNGATDATLDWLTFLLSLIPVPGVAEASAIANKVFNDRSLGVRFDAIVTGIGQLDSRINAMESGLQRVEVIGAIAKDNADALALVKAFFDELKSRETEFSVETADWSTQQIIRTLIEADWVSISATNQSENFVVGTKVRAGKTSLVAKDGSKNVIQDSSFSADKGSVTMMGKHTQQGNVSLTGPSVSFAGQNSQLEALGWSIGTNRDGNFEMASHGNPFMTVTTTPVYSLQCRCGTHGRQRAQSYLVNLRWSARRAVSKRACLRFAEDPFFCEAVPMWLAACAAGEHQGHGSAKKTR